MANDLVGQLETRFSKNVFMAYTSRRQILQNTTEVERSVSANSIDVKKVGTVETSVWNAFDDPTVSDGGIETVNYALERQRATLALDVIQLTQVTPSLLDKYAAITGQALSRFADRLKIAAMVAATPGLTIAEGSTNFTLDKLTQINEYFDDNAVDPEDRHIALPASAIKNIINDVPELTNQDFIEKGVIKSGNFRGAFIMGMHWHIIPTLAVNSLRLPISGNIQTIFAWQKMSISFGWNTFQTKMFKSDLKGSWFTDGWAVAGCKVIDGSGLVQCDYDKTA